MQEKFNFYHKELFKKIEETNILFFKSMGKGHGPLTHKGRHESPISTA